MRNKSIIIFSLLATVAGLGFFSNTYTRGFRGGGFRGGGRGMGGRGFARGGGFRGGGFRGGGFRSGRGMGRGFARGSSFRRGSGFRGSRAVAFRRGHGWRGGGRRVAFRGRPGGHGRGVRRWGRPGWRGRGVGRWGCRGGRCGWRRWGCWGGRCGWRWGWRWPYWNYGYGWNWPYRYWRYDRPYTESVYVEDRAIDDKGHKYWEIYNATNSRLRFKPYSGTTRTIMPWERGKIWRAGSFGFTVRRPSGEILRDDSTSKHFIILFDRGFGVEFTNRKNKWLNWNG